ncbi:MULTISPECIES: helix-turn-helix transcriptional regulator [unclassified Brevundimonas]|uniref:helix-turn-helix domain-containing protein n=1 Tax=unclassified Brevundimonas TaxID=2622653 RepID=UPI0025BC31B1|nr:MULTISPECIES: helix-turn-helix transcriptional regulator [unclassified Brevundimonas]
MARFTSDDDAGAEGRALGEALSALRRERGLSQAEAGTRIGMTSQGWGLYEAGKRPGLFRPDVQRRLTAALDATPEDLALLVGAVPAPISPPRTPSDELQARGRAFEAAPMAERRRLQLSTDDLAPWAAAGTVLEYAPGRWPRRDQGCVIEMDDGSLRARLYVRSDEVELVVRGAGALLTIERIPRHSARAVSAVTARLDE